MSIRNFFKIVTGTTNHTGTAILNYGGHTIHLCQNKNNEPSSLIVFKVSEIGTLEGPAVFGPFSVTLENIVATKDFIDAENHPESDYVLPAFLTRQAK